MRSFMLEDGCGAAAIPRLANPNIDRNLRRIRPPFSSVLMFRPENQRSRHTIETYRPERLDDCAFNQTPRVCRLSFFPTQGSRLAPCPAGALLLALRSTAP